MTEDNLSKKELDLFRDLKREANPPASLESKVVNALSEQSLVKKTNILPIFMKAVTGIAAAILIFVGGVQYERTFHVESVAINPSNGYILLINEDQNFQPGDPMAMFEEYSIWMENLAKQGVKIDGQELRADVATVKDGKDNVPYQITSTQRTTGYFIIEADTPEEAVSIAQASPHVKYGGTIDVKPFMIR